MANNIKGITIEIDGDTVGLQNALRDVNNQTRDLQSELKDVQRALKLDPNNVELLAQRQQLLAQQVETTTQKLNRLKDTQAQVQAQFERGDIGEEAYRAFRRELIQTEQALQGYQDAIQDMNSEQEKVAQGTRQLTTLFEATESSVEDYANVIGQRLVRAIQNSTATSRDLEYAFQRIGRQAIGTNGDLERLRTSLNSVDSGNSLESVRRDMQQLASESEDAQGSVKELGGELTGMVAGLAAGGGIAGVIEKALDTSSLNTKIDISFDVPEESVQSVKNAISTIETYGIDAESALEGVRRQWSLNKTISDETNTAIVKGAAAISAAYGDIDFTELIQETHEIANSLGMTHENALGLVNSLIQIGFPPDQLDIITEYGSQLARAGYNAEEIQGIFTAGVDTGTWNIDVLLDGLKEGRIVMAEFGQGIDKSTKQLLDGTGISAKQLEEWGNNVAAGGEKGKKAMTDVAAALNGVKDETQKNALDVKIFGTLYEENGQNIIDTLLNAKTATGDLKANQEQLNESTKKLDADSAVKLQTALSNMQTALTPLLTSIAELVTKVAEWVAENPKLSATITAIATGIGILVGIAMAVAPIIMAITGAMAAFEVAASPVILIVLAIIAAIAALIAIGVLLYKHWDDIKAKAIEVWGAIKEWFAESFTDISEGITTAWESIKTYTSETWESIKQTTSDVWTAIKDFFINIWTSITTGAMAIIQPFIDGAMNIFNSMKDGLQTMFTGLQQYFSGVWELIKNIFLGAVLLIVDLVTGDFEGLKNDAIAIFNNIQSALGSIWEGIKNIFSGAVSAIKGFVSQAWENIKSNTSNIFNAIKSAITSVWNGIKSFFTTTIPNIKNAVVNGFEGMKNSVQEKITAIKTKISEIWNNIVSYLKGIDLSSIGTNIIQGLYNGIVSKAKSIYDKAREIADNIKSIIKKALDINSPSRVMMEIGEYTGEGLALGMKNSLGQISGMAEKMATTATPNIQLDPISQMSNDATNNSALVNAIVQLASRPISLLVDGREVAIATVDDITQLQNFKTNRSKLF